MPTITTSAQQAAVDLLLGEWPMAKVEQVGENVVVTATKWDDSTLIIQVKPDGLCSTRTLGRWDN